MRTHPSYASTDNGNAVFLESFVYSIPNQATPDYSSARGCIVGYLGKLSGIDMDSLCRRKPGVRSVATALHLEHEELGI